MARGKITIWKGNGMGIVISAEGITIIPPCDPQIVAGMRAIQETLRVQPALGRTVQREVGAFTTTLGSFVFAGVDKAVGGGLDTESGVVFQDDDGGFSCGSTGRIRPLPRPGLRIPVDRVLVG